MRAMRFRSLWPSSASSGEKFLKVFCDFGEEFGGNTRRDLDLAGKDARQGHGEGC
jgi:hypothetical protein